MALLDFPNVIGANGPNPDIETSNFVGVCDTPNSHFFNNVGLSGKASLGLSASRDIVITQFGHYAKVVSKPGTLTGDLLSCCHCDRQLVMQEKNRK